MLQVTDDLIRNVVQEVLAGMKGKPIVAQTPSPSPSGRGEYSHSRYGVGG